MKDPLSDAILQLPPEIAANLLLPPRNDADALSLFSSAIETKQKLKNKCPTCRTLSRCRAKPRLEAMVKRAAELLTDYVYKKSGKGKRGKL